jgi:hypothetical protein
LCYRLPSPKSSPPGEDFTDSTPAPINLPTASGLEPFGI